MPQSSVTPLNGEVPPAADPTPAESGNVALVRQALDAFAERDIQKLLKLVHPSMELFAPGTAALTHDGRSYRGYAGIFTYFRDIGRVWLEMQIVPHEFLDAGSAVVVFGRLRARAYGGFLIDQPTQWVVRINEGKIAWVSICDSRESALELAAAELARPGRRAARVSESRSTEFAVPPPVIPSAAALARLAPGPVACSLAASSPVAIATAVPPPAMARAAPPAERWPGTVTALESAGPGG